MSEKEVLGDSIKQTLLRINDVMLRANVAGKHISELAATVEDAKNSLILLQNEIAGLKDKSDYEGIAENVQRAILNMEKEVRDVTEHVVDSVNEVKNNEKKFIKDASTIIIELEKLK